MAIFVAALALPAGAAPSPVPGRGYAAAQTVKVDPKAGGLSIGVTLGLALAGHQNGEAKAQSQAIDLGAVGTSLTGYDCGKPPTFKPSQLPQPLIVETGDPQASSGVTQPEEGGAFTKFAKATATPYSEAVTTSAPVAIAGVVSVGAGIARVWSGLVDGERVAGASVRIAGITLPGNVTVAPLQWDAVFPSGGGSQPQGSFTIGGVSGASALSALNAVLNPLGLSLQLPVAHVTQGVLFVDPLVLSVVPNATRDHLLSTVLTGIQPVRQPVIDAVLKAYCQADTEITVADVAIGSISGAGSFELALGGVQADSGLVSDNGFKLGGFGLLPPGLAPVSTLGSAPAPAVSTLGSPSGPFVPVGPAPLLATAPSALGSLPIHVHRPTGHRGGALLAVALGTLALVGLLIEGDRRTMRRFFGRAPA